tara:strand:- start:357 stop:698 length:342 start_codon:yes stop_codon:yes gene_type:complete
LSSRVRKSLASRASTAAKLDGAFLFGPKVGPDRTGGGFGFALETVFLVTSLQRAGAELDDTSTAVFARSSFVRGETFSQDGFSFTPSATFFPLLNSAASTALIAAISMSSLDS